MRYEISKNEAPQAPSQANRISKYLENFIFLSETQTSSLKTNFKKVLTNKKKYVKL